jgi:hypothetical protein
VAEYLSDRKSLIHTYLISTVVHTFPVGLWGVLSMIALVFALMAASSSDISSDQYSSPSFSLTLKGTYTYDNIHERLAA